jgi:diacylglycerol kinase (ATP)
MEKRLKFCIIINANASGGRKLKLVNEVIYLLKIDHDVELFKTISEENAKEIFKNLSVKNFDRLVLAGGDGSVCFGINQIFKYPSLVNKKIGYIPTGTANILQIETKILKNAKFIAKILITGNTKQIFLSKINDKFFFLMAGIGFDGKIVASINTKIKRHLGKIIFALKGFQHFLFLENNKMEILIDGKKLEADWILSMSSKYYAGSHEVTKTTDIFQNGLVTYIFKDLTRVKLLYYLFLIFFYGDLSRAKSITITQAKNIKINKLNSNLAIQTDGEIFSSKERVEIQQTNKFIKLLTV